MKLMLLLWLLAYPAYVVGADIFRWVDQDGNVHFSDRPREGAERLKTEPAQTFAPNDLPADTMQQTRPATAPDDPAAADYSRFAISHPANDEAIRANAGNIAIQLAISPPLQVGFGHSITLTMDGTTVAEGVTNTQIPLNNVDRGTHVLQAVVKNPRGDVVKAADPVTFHLLRAHLRTP